MNKNDLVANVASGSGLSKSDAAKAVAFEVIESFERAHGHAPRIYSTGACDGARIVNP